jgi:hypothetical protein
MSEDKLTKIKLQFNVDPAWLESRTYVNNPVRVKVLRPDLLFLTGILGESGRAMVLEGFPFIFEGKIAEEYIKLGIFEKLPDAQSRQSMTAEILDLKQLVDQGRKLATRQLEVHAKESQTLLSELSEKDAKIKELEEALKEILGSCDGDLCADMNHHEIARNALTPKGR